MCDAIVGGVFAIVGVVVGALSNLMIEKQRTKKEKEFALLQTNIDTYTKAIRYIIVLARLTSYENASNDISVPNELTIEEKTLYNDFYPVFSVIASKEKIIKYNALRNQIQAEGMSPDIAYQKALDVLDYNACRE